MRLFASSSLLSLRNLAAACTIFAACSINIARAAEPAGSRPPLALGIIVEGLNDDILATVEPMLGEGGFKRLMSRGAHISDLYFGPGIDPVAATAMLLSGASPMVNGIPAAQIYSPETKLTSAVLYDPKTMGNFTDETISPTALKVSTLADELRIETDGNGTVFAIGIDPQQTVLSAGHASNGAFWLYDHNGKWATSTYYKELPSAVNTRNYRTPLSSRIDTMKWTPLRAPEAYTLLSQAERSKPFSISFPAKRADRYTSFKTSPLANTEVTDLAIELIGEYKMGRDNATDLLQLGYNLSRPGVSRYELIDMYLRLDRDLARLFEAADRNAGHGNTIVFLAGTPAPASYSPDASKWRIPTGEFSVRKAKSLVEMYLMANHGNGDWLTGYHDRQFYLNRKLITDRNLNVAQVRTEVADLLARMSGVCNVYTIDDIIATRAGDDPQGLKRNTSIEHCGDVFVEINPGWVLTDEGGTRLTSKPIAERRMAPSVSAFILAPNVAPQKIEITVDARALAPAVARQLRVRTPNGASIGTLRLKPALR